MTRKYARVDILSREDLKGVKIVKTAVIGTLYGVDEEFMDTGESTLALLMEFKDGSEQLVAMSDEALDELLRYVCVANTNTEDQATKLYGGFLFLKEALTK